MLEEMLPGTGPKEEEVGPDPGGAHLSGRPDDLPQLLGPVGDAGQDRRHADARLHAGVNERLHRLEPLAWMRGRWLCPLPHVVVERRDRERSEERRVGKEW